MRRGFLGPRPAPLPPSTVAFNRGEAALRAGQLYRARRFLRLALQIDPRYDIAGDYLVEVEFCAAQRIQAIARGIAPPLLRWPLQTL